MLARMKQELGNAEMAEHTGRRRRLDELGARADDRQQIWRCQCFLCHQIN